MFCGLDSWSRKEKAGVQALLGEREKSFRVTRKRLDAKVLLSDLNLFQEDLARD